MRVIRVLMTNDRVLLTREDIFESVVSDIAGQLCCLTGWLGSPLQ